MEVKQQKMVADLFEQAVDTYNSAFKTGVRMQEELAKWWTDMLGEASPMQDWQKRAQAIMADSIPLAKKTTEEGLRAIDENYRNSMELLKKAFDASQWGSMAEAREKLQSLWEASLGTMRMNAQALMRANSSALESWSEFARRNFDGGKIVAEGKQAARAAAAASK